MSPLFRFVVLLGFVSLFADVTYEGARSINGQFLYSLGASAAVVGFVAGFGELLGYGLRLLTGWFTDRRGNHWQMTVFGYIVNIFANPFMAFAPNWLIASSLIVSERIGKAFRNPARDALLSFAAKEVGSGKTFGVHKTLDLMGGLLGPLFVFGLLYFAIGYRAVYFILFIPALLAVALLFYTWRHFRHIHGEKKIIGKKSQFSKQFWLFMITIFFYGAGFVDFPLIAYHFTRVQVVSVMNIPIFYALAMFIGSISAYLTGHWFEKKQRVLLISVLVASFCSSPLLFMGSDFLIPGIILWGLGFGAGGTLISAVVTELVASDERGFAFGLGGAILGIGWFLGSVLMGFLYDFSSFYLVIASCIMELMALIALSKFLIQLK